MTKFNPLDFKAPALSEDDLRTLIQEEKGILLEREKRVEELKSLLSKVEEDVTFFRDSVLKNSMLLKEELRKKEYVINECICGHCGSPRYVRKVDVDFDPSVQKHINDKPMEFTDSELESSGIDPKLVTKSILTFSTCSGCGGYEM